MLGSHDEGGSRQEGKETREERRENGREGVIMISWACKGGSVERRE